jgi:hypothetical protein
MNITKINLVNVKLASNAGIRAGATAGTSQLGLQIRARGTRLNVARPCLFSAAAALLMAHSAIADADDNFQQILPFQTVTASTIPSNGDVNPYGVALCPALFLAGGFSIRVISWFLTSTTRRMSRGLALRS